MQALSAAIGAGLLFGVEAGSGVAALGGILFLNVPTVLAVFLWLGLATALGVGVTVGLFVFRRERQLGSVVAATSEPIEPNGLVGGTPA
jgi:formate-dependent nitrite reductase membrane component NrfD